MQIMPSVASLLRGNRGRAQDQNRSRVLIRLVAPQPRWLLSEFMRIRLSSAMLAGGELKRRREASGVVALEIPLDGLLNPDAEPANQLVEKFVLVLDRRYRDEVLAAVYRTAGFLGEQIGVRIK